jgi:integrase
LFVRPGELRSAEWSQINFESAEWRFTASKTQTEHIVPLSTQAVAILKDLHYLTGDGRYVFPSPRSSDRPMSENALLAAIRSLGISKDEMCPHGFRATARTLLDEVLGFPPHLIEHQLAHAVKDSLGRAYNRTTHLPERREMMQRWSDYLESLTDG